MHNLKPLLTIAFYLLISTAFCQGKADKTADILKGINVYFPGSEVKGDKLDLNVQGGVVTFTLCNVNIAIVDEHDFSIATKEKGEKIMRAGSPTTFVSLGTVRSKTDRIVELLNRLKSVACGK